VITLLAIFFAERVDLHALISGLVCNSLGFALGNEKDRGVTEYRGLGKVR
jgi:hypothetical protein